MSTWFAQRVLDLVRMLTNVYYTRKYGAMARRLGRPGITPDQRRGFIIIQIDGLSHDHLMQALAAGYTPYLARLLAEHRLVVAPWRCGLPSTTPAVQAGIMFGNRFDIPGFRWYEKERGLAVMVRRPDQIQAVRARVSRGRPGILRGGSCYVSMFDGDADLALFTLSTLHRQRFFESVRGMGLFLLFLLSPFRVLRLLGLITVSYLAGLGRRLVALVQPSILNPFDVFSPLLHAVSDALFTEVQTFGVMLDIYRCVPAIYANYNSYDEVAHKLGPDHPAAFRVLRSVDKRIRQIDRMRARYHRRKYDLYILSDHGNTPSVPFSWRNGMSLGQYILAQIGEGLSVAEQTAAYAHSTEKARYLLEELRGLEERFSPRLRRALAAARRYVDQRVLAGQERCPEFIEGLEYDLERQQDVIACASGPLAHVYSNVSPRPLDLIEVILLYPQLLDSLLATPGIGAIAGRAGERTIVLGHEGGMLVIGGQREMADGPHPLVPFGDAAYAAAQVHYLAHFPHAGDLIVLGAVEPDGKVVTFEEQVATHGGLGGPQLQPFIAWPPQRPLVPGILNDAQDLYPYFVRHYLEQSQASKADGTGAGVLGTY
nr:hypothetical protein [Anaerolineae bacterium]